MRRLLDEPGEWVLDTSTGRLLRQEHLKKINADEYQPTGVSGVLIDYDARGFALNVDQEKGLQAIFCRAGELAVRDFTGKTTEGVRMGSTLEEIEKAYGPADKKYVTPEKHEVSLYYRSLCMQLHLKEDRLSDLSIHLGDKDEDL